MLLAGPRIRETSITSGTGTLTLLGAVSSYQTFLSGIGSGNKCYYTVIDGNSWESGIGTVSGSTLTRDIVYNSSTGGSKLTLSANTKDVFCDVPAQAFPVLGFGQCRLLYISSTQLKLIPVNGNQILIKDSGTWRPRLIPSTGISSANTGVYVNGVTGSNLSANTLYLVTLFDNSGSLAFDFTTSVARSYDSDSGMPIKAGDPTRVIVGMIRTGAFGEFVNDTDRRFVISWFNRNPIIAFNTLKANRSTTSQSYVDICTSAERAQWLLWSDSQPLATLGGNGDVNGVGWLSTSLGLDGSSTVLPVGSQVHSAAPSLSVGVSLSGTWPVSISDGYHFSTIVGAVQLGFTGFWRTGLPENTTGHSVIIWG